MADKYLELTSEYFGVTLRVFYEEKQGVVTIPDIRLKTSKYSGTWYMGGTISIDGETVLTSSYYNPATHAFSFWGVGDTFASVEPIQGGSNPKDISKRILGKTKATLNVELELYHEKAGKPSLVGSVDIPLTIGLVHIDDGTGFKPYEVYVDDGERWVRCIPYIDDGTKWVQCG